MKILHYSLGLPPFRSGGLTKYATDLMLEQVSLNHEVSLLYPGSICYINKKTKIKSEKNYSSIHIYELINPLPVSLVFGISDTQPYFNDTDGEVYRSFFKRTQPDCIHLHTIMGLHPSFIKIAKELGIKIFLTTHDYYGLWPDLSIADNYTKMQHNNFLLGDITNMPELSLNKVILAQSKVYRLIKDTKIIKKVRKVFKSNAVSDTESPKLSTEFTEAFYAEIILKKEKYIKLREHYIENFFNQIDVFLFNSSVSKMVYESFVKINDSEVITLTHGSISKNKKNGQKKVKSDELAMLFIGDTNYFKGLPYLLEVIDTMEDEIKNKVTLTTVGKKINRSYCNVIEPYKLSGVSEVMSKYDLVIYPSMCFETLGFGIIEAYQEGKLSLVSKFVGGADIVKLANSGFIFNNEEQLKEIIFKLTNNEELYNSKISEMNKTNFSMKSLKEHATDILDRYVHYR